MAEAKKGAAALYGKGPRIEEDKADGDKAKSTGGAPKEAHAKAEESAGSPKTMTENKSVGDSGTEAKGDVMAGTDGIMTHHTHMAERTEMHHRHMLDHAHMHGRHMHDHAMRMSGHSKESHEDMNKRHNDEMRSMHTRHEGEHRAMNERHASAPFSADAPAPEGAAAAPGGAPGAAAA